MSELFLNFHKNDEGNADKPRQLFIFGDAGEVVTVKNGNGFNQTVTLNNQGFEVVEIPVSEGMSGTGVNNLGFQITSENPIQAYFSNRASATTDLTIVFEKSSLGTEYVLSSIGFDNDRDGVENGQFSVQATEDNTTIDVILTNGQTFSQTINAGETFKFATDVVNSELDISIPLDFDLTGTIIQSTAPVAVFSGHGCTNIGDGGACDHIVEQMPPVDVLSTSYIVGEAFKNGSGDNLIRVVAANNDTQVTVETVDGSEVVTLSAGEFHEFILSKDAAQITTSKPALVAQYLQGVDTVGEGDPAMMFVPGQNAWLKKYKLATPAGSAVFKDNLVNVVIPTTARESLKLNGVAVDTDGFVPVGSSGFSVGNLDFDNLEIAPGLFTMEASEPFQVSLFGFDEDDSYLTFGAATFASGISNEFPILAINNGLTLDEDAVGNITSTQLQVTDADNTAAEITYTVTDLTDNGDLLLNGNPLAVNDTFTQDDIDNNRLTYDHDGSETTSDSFDFTVNDGAGGSIDSSTFDITLNPIDDLEVTISAPRSIAANGTDEVTVTYRNTGDTEIAAPLLSLEASGALFRSDVEAEFGDNQVQFLGLNNQGVPGVLPPGASNSFTVEFKSDATSSDGIDFVVNAIDEDTVIDWESLRATSRPDFIPAEAWDETYDNFVAQVGTKAGDYQQLLIDNANYLSELGQYEPYVENLLAFEFQQASDFQAISQRYSLGSFGRGRTFIGDLELSTDEEGNVSISNSGTVRTFDRLQDGTYQAQTGDFATVSFDDNTGIYTLTEKDGTATIFNSDGKIDFIEDTNGNRSTASYTNGQLTTLTDSFGNSLTFEYNDDGRIVTVTDSDGRITTYGYDTSGELLETVTDETGTTTYTYDGVAVASITDPNGTKIEFSYDAQGRLEQQNITSTTADGVKTEVINYTYGEAGEVTVTDGLGNETQLLLNENGQVGQLTDANGRLINFNYDNQGNLNQIIAPQNNSTLFGYDDRGNLTSQVDANGNITTFTYDPTFNQLTSFTDSLGNGITYDYDESGNLEAIEYADGSKETFDYNDNGDVTVSVNRRGQQILYSYNERGQVTSQVNPDSDTPITYTYDARGNVDTVTYSSGTIDFDYDNTDRLTKITYPGGRFLEYTYDAGDRRTSMTDQNGNRVNYSYDDAGRLASLTDGDNNLIVSYEYDAVGRLAREDKGNSTYTVYSYDQAGQLLSIENYAPDDTLNSSSVYTYDNLGRQTSLTTLDGEWAYDYDAVGQLTGAVLVSTNPDIPNQNLSYEYDAAGNRINTIKNGETTGYISNNLNQYTEVNGFEYQYDEDGNLISKTNQEGTFLYSYNSENKLISVTEPNGTLTSYEYDPFGNRIASVRDGVRTEYLIDPFGFGDVVGEYNADGNLIASYTHGLGLETINKNEASYYYDFNAVGSTVGLTDASGGVANSYFYSPFGNDISETETVVNPYEFVGQFGVAEEANGLDFMRARFYDSNTGRFISPDPIGLEGGDINLYRYGLNNPNSYIDSNGEFPVLPFVFGFLGATFLTPDQANAPTGPCDIIYPSPTVGEIALNSVAPLVGYGIGNFFNEWRLFPFFGEAFRFGIKKASESAGKKIFKGTGNSIFGRGEPRIFDPNECSKHELEPEIKPEISFESVAESTTNINSENDSDNIPSSPNNQARSKGEPHLTTFDGIGYDFQGAGEFTLVESLDDDLNIQVRYVQIDNNVTVASAVATEVDGKNVVIDSEGIEFVDENGNPVTEGGIPQVNRRLSGGEAKVIIDGVEVDITSGGSIEVGNSRIYRSSGEEYTVVYAGEDGVLNDGDDQLVVNYFRPGTLNTIDVYLGDENKGQITGLLGSLNDNPDDDIALRDGTVLPRPLEFDRLYGDYRDDYRIKDISESLFTYEPGQNPDTFYNPNFPEAPFSYKDLDPEAKARGDAAALAAGYTPGTFEFESAAFDFAVTNDPGFLEGRETDPEVQQSLEVVDDGNNGGEPPTVDDATFRVDENSTFGTEVGVITATDPENQALTFAIVLKDDASRIANGNLDPDNDSNLAFAIDPSSGKITVNDKDDLDFEATPTFNLEVTATNAGGLSDTANITVKLKDVPSAEFDTNQSQNGTFTLNGGDSTNIKFTLANNNTEKVNEVGVFIVDDENGSVDGNAPGSEGYLKAALQRAEVIFSAISDRPTGFELEDIQRVLEVDGDARLRFYLVSNGTTDTALTELESTGETNLPIFFSDSSNVQISDLNAQGFNLNWSDEVSGSTYNDMELKVEFTQDAPAAGTELQGQPQNELIDLSNETGQVSVSVEVHREAAFDNLIGFYQVVDTNGGIDTNGDGVVDFNPGDAGYEEAALTNRITGLDLLQTDDQQTSTFDGTFDGGSILASFMVVDGTVDEAINNNAEVYFSFLGANSDGVDHIRLLGDNTFGYEDLAGGGDFDYNDMIVKVNPTV